MVNDTPEISSLPFKMIEINPNLREGGQANIQNYISDFLNKPVLVDSVNWTQAGAANDILLSGALPWSTSNESALWREKLKGFLGFRAKAHITVHVNASRQAQGRLLLHYIPLAQEMTSNVVASRNHSLITKTQQVSIDMSVNSANTMSMEIPYVHPRNYYNLETRAGQFGTWYLSIYSPYYSSVAGDLKVSVWVHFTDVELAVPTLQTVLQMNRELTQNVDRPLSGPLKTVARGLGQLSMIPALTSVTAPLAWATQVLAKTAQAFGYSKPQASCAIQRVKIAGDVSGNSYDITDDAYPTAFSSQNSVKVLPGFAGIDIDEMSISYIANRPSHWYTFPFATSNVAGDALLGDSVYPMKYCSVPGTNVYAFTPLAFISSQFMYWRGGITYHIKFTKTEFHTGRLIFYFRPGSTSTTPSIADTNYLFREVLDIKLQDEFHITIPYTSLRPWMKYDEPIGYAGILVESPLKAPTNVNTSIDAHVQISGADDVAFAVPMNVSTVPAQFGTTVQMNDPYATTVGNSKSDAPTIEPDVYCIGERILSLKQLMLRRSRLTWGTSTNAKRYLYFNPYDTYSCLVNSGTYAVSPLPLLCGDYYNTFASLFALSRGSVRCKVGSAASTMFRTGYFTDLASTRVSTVTSSSTYTVEPPNGYVEQVGGTVCAQAPVYGQHHSRVNRMLGESVTYTYGSIDSRVQLWVGSSDSVAFNDWQPLRSVSDDFAFGMFVGVPLMYYNTSMPAPTYDGG